MERDSSTFVSGRMMNKKKWKTESDAKCRSLIQINQHSTRLTWIRGLATIDNDKRGNWIYDRHV